MSPGRLGETPRDVVCVGWGGIDAYGSVFGTPHDHPFRFPWVCDVRSSRFDIMGEG